MKYLEIRTKNDPQVFMRASCWFFLPWRREYSLQVVFKELVNSSTEFPTTVDSLAKVKQIAAQVRGVSVQELQISMRSKEIEP